MNYPRIHSASAAATDAPDLTTLNPRSSAFICGFILLALVTLLRPALAKADLQSFKTEPMPSLPYAVEGGYLGTHGGAVILAGGVKEDDSAATADILVLPDKADAWQPAGTLPTPRAFGATTSVPTGVICLGGVTDGQPTTAATRLQWTNGQLTALPLPDLPTPLAHPAATAIGDKVYVAAGQIDAEGQQLSHDVYALDTATPDATWQKLEPWPGAPLRSALLVALQDTLYLFGQSTTGQPVAYRYQNDAWSALTSPPYWPQHAAGTAYGQSHVFIFSGPGDDAASNNDILAYHRITDRWVNIGRLDQRAAANPMVVSHNGKDLLISGTQVLTVAPQPVKTNYGFIDHLVVAAYLLGMIGMGWYFAKRENSTKDYFRGGNRVPWWAAGMSLFATGASAISLMGMPGMSFGLDWTYFTISIYSAMCLPIGIFVIAPLVRRLNIATANEYLERRFGIVARLFASVIFMFTQIGARMASVMLLSAIALEAITGMDIMVCILIMGLVTTVYTYLGGLEAVIWTDTVQGFIMCLTVIGCLALALWLLPMGAGEIWGTLSSYDKFHMFDWKPTITRPVVYIFFANVFITTLAGITDQNFVQRVQSTPDLRQTKLAVATQMAVAVPINVLLFGLGTALWLFYRSNPEALSPTIMTNDGVFPFFAAQQLPVGVSGVVVAALLAATMSTVSSSICSVSDLGTNDFYRRFKHDATDHQCLVLGRVLTAVVGILGTVAAIILASIPTRSVWDLAIMVTGLISNGILGLFLLGLLTRRAHEWGALLGAVSGMAVIATLRWTGSPITFWLYIVIGPMVTIAVGYLCCLILPGKPRQTDGLTLYTLKHADHSAPVTPGPETELATVGY